MLAPVAGLLGVVEPEVDPPLFDPDGAEAPGLGVVEPEEVPPEFDPDGAEAPELGAAAVAPGSGLLLPPPQAVRRPRMAKAMRARRLVGIKGLGNLLNRQRGCSPNILIALEG